MTEIFYTDFKKILLILIVLIPFSSSAKKKSQIEAPTEVYDTKEYVLQTSNINFPIEVDVATIEKLFNEYFQGLIYEDNNLDDDDMMIKAWKIRDFKVRTENNSFVYTIPVKLWIKAGWRIDKVISLSDYREFEAEIELNFKTKFSINKNWEIISNTTIESYNWLKKPIIKIGTFNIPITTVADALIKYNRETFHQQIDESVKEYAPLREYAQELWEWSQEPFEISEEYKTWVRFVPLEITASPITFSGNKVMVDICLTSNIETHVGGKPRVKINKALPFYQESKSTNKDFNINMLAKLDYHTVDSIAKGKLIGQTFSEGKYHATVLDLNFYGHAGKLVVAVKLKGTFTGQVYFTGTPYYDKENKSIKLQNFDFDFKTRNVLINSSKWLYKNTFKNFIASKMVFNISEYIDEIKENIQPLLIDMELHENLSAQCFLKDITVDDVFLMETGINAAISFDGNLKLKIK